MGAKLPRSSGISLGWIFVILFVCAPIRTVLASNIIIDFDGISGGDGSQFTSYTESGFTVSAITQNWLVDLNYGHPAPMIIFKTETTETFAVMNGGAGFYFSAIDLYSSLSHIPYTFIGFLNGNQVFTSSGDAPNPMGGFDTVENPYSMVQIDTLDVSLTNPTNPNPIGADNIAVETTPEPASLLLLTSGITSLSLRKLLGRIL